MPTKNTPPDKKDDFVSRREFDETVTELQTQIKTLSDLYEKVMFLQVNSLPLIRKKADGKNNKYKDGIKKGGSHAV